MNPHQLSEEDLEIFVVCEDTVGIGRSLSVLMTFENIQLFCASNKNIVIA